MTSEREKGIQEVYDDLGMPDVGRQMIKQIQTEQTSVP